MEKKIYPISVSVIIPVYNAEFFLADTIKSVLEQSLGNLEIILINDGSTDNSELICEEYCTQNQNILYFSQSNSGVSVARNLGRVKASGKYLYFLDSDDTLDPHFLKSSFDVAEKNNYDLVIVGKEFCERMPNATALPTCAMFLKKEFLDNHTDIIFPRGIQPCEDGIFSHELLAITNKIGLNPQGIYHYRQHENQNHHIINQNTDRILKQIPVWFEILENFYLQNKFFKSHALHLALFVEHEPFEFRYLAMPFSSVQKEKLYNEIKYFLNKNVVDNLVPEDYSKLSQPFIYLINCNSSFEFDIFYKKYVKRQAFNKKIRLLLAKLIPFSKLRRKIRKETNERYSR